MAFALAAGIFSASANAELAQADEPGINPNRDYVHQHFAEHIDPYNGNLELQYVDIFLPGNGGFDLKVQRSYNALLAKTDSAFGRGWQIHFGRVYHRADQTCSTASIQTMVLELPDGGSHTLYKSNGVAGTSSATDYITSSMWKAQCNTAGVGIIVYSPDGTKYEMTEADGNYWHVSRITDRSGNSMTFEYVFNSIFARKFVKSVTTSDLRSVTFNYTSDRLASIVTQGRTWNYTIQVAADGKGNLTTVRPPEGSSWQYAYFGDRGPTVAGSFALQTLTYPQGGTITYDYQFVNFVPGVVTPRSWVAVSSKTTTDGQWRFAYTPSTTVGTLDKTVATLPGALGSITYEHFGYGSAGQGEVWKIGSLIRKTISAQFGAAQTENYTFSSQKISDEAQTRDGYGIWDIAIYRPLLDVRSLSRDSGTFTTNYQNRDSYGNPTLITETGGQSRTRNIPLYFNDSSKWILGLPLDETVQGVGTISRTRFPDGRIATESPFGVTTTYTYTSQGDIASRKNARNFTTSFTGYSFGVPATETRPEGVTITRHADVYGNVDQESDGEYVWRYSYDNLNRVSGVTYPIGTAATISWPTDRRRTLTRGSYTHITDFDAYGRVTAIAKGGIQQTFQVDPLGRRTQESLPGSASVIAYSLDPLGRPTTITSPAGTKTFSYGSANVWIQNERGLTTTYTYDRYGDPDEGYLTGIDAGAGTAVTMDRNQVGTLLSATQGGVTRTYGRDTHLFLATLAEPETGTTTFSRDAVGNMQSKTVSNSLGSETINFTYDGLDRLKTSTYPGTAGTISFTYDGRGKLTQVSSPGVVRNYDFDANGNLKQDELLLDGRDFTVVYDYDTIDGLNLVTYPSGGAVTYSPDALGRPQAALPYLTNVQHFPSGNLSSATYANGASMTYGENAWQLPNRVQAASAQIDLTYSYDGVGNVKTITDAYGGTYDRTLNYDAADRLTSATGPWGSGTLDYTGDGNLRFQQFGSYRIDYTYSNSKLTNIAGSRSMSFTYDKWGNVTGNGSMTFAYDSASHMTCAKCGSQDEVVYQYDGQGRRVSEEKGGYKTYFVQAPNGDLQYEYTPYGKVWTKHAYLHGKRVASETDSDALATTTTLTGASTWTYGSPATFNVTVSPTSTGTVEVREGATLLATGTLASSQSSIPLPNLTAGSHSIVAAYLGDANNAPSTSAAKTITVSKLAATVVASVSPSTGPLGQTATLTATVNGSAPTGEVQFLEGATVLGTQTAANGIASFTTAPLTAGAHTFSASYLGDGNHLSADANSVSATINQGSASIALTSSNPSIFTGQVVTFTAALTGTQSILPTGSVSFFDGGVSLGNGSVNGQGSASFTTNTLPAGTHTITASYSGDSNYVSVGSSPVTQQVAARATSATQVSLPARPIYSNQSITVAISVTGTTPGGIAHVKSDGVEVGAANIGGGLGTASLRLAVGTHLVQAIYDGDVNNNPSTSPTVSVTVRPGQQPQDFNLDGKADLLWFRASDRMAMTWQMDGATIDLNSPSFGAGAVDTQLMGAGDFDGNGTTDLVWFRSTDRMVSLQLAATGAQQNVLPLDADWTFGQVADFDGDGKADIFWFHPDGRTLIWTMNGSQLVSTTTIASGGVGYVPIGAADFNGDGKADLLWYRSSDGMLKVQLTGGATAEIGAGSSGSELRAIGDMNADGMADLVWYKPADRSVTAWLMNGVQISATSAFGQGAADFELIGAADFNGDGKADGIWVRASDAMLAFQFTGGAWTTVDNGDPGWVLKGIGQPLPNMITSRVPSITVGSSVNPSTVGQYIEITGVVSGVGGTPTGTLVFFDNGNTISGCGGLTMVNGQATCTPGSLTQGTHSITVVYSGNGTYNGITSSTLPQTVDPAKPYTPSFTLGSSQNPSASGAVVTFTAVLSGAGGTPTGNVVFRDNGVTISGCGGIALTNGRVTCSPRLTTVGTHSITGIYLGDSNYNGITSSTLPQAVQ